jgi:hypothetical protein
MTIPFKDALRSNARVRKYQQLLVLLLVLLLLLQAVHTSLPERVQPLPLTRLQIFKAQNSKRNEMPQKHHRSAPLQQRALWSSLDFLLSTSYRRHQMLKYQTEVGTPRLLCTVFLSPSSSPRCATPMLRYRWFRVASSSFASTPTRRVSSTLKIVQSTA